MLSVNNLTSSYGQAPVIHQISLEVGRGEVCAIMGPNGAGKSTLLRTIMGIVPNVLSGTVALANGRSLDRLPTHAIASLGIAYVPEGRGILNSLTVLENLQLGTALLKMRYPQEDAAKSMAKVLDSFPMLKGRTQEPAGLLSGGQQQMLAIARALISKPSVLLLDEPSLGLAPLIRLEVANLLRKIADSERVAVLLAEQDITLAQRCADRVYVLRRGRIVAQMSADELHDHDRLRQLYLGATEIFESAASN
jgi:branched-chain amino acid transport system ATP-binding protein